MAVTIDEVHVDVSEAQPQPAGPAAGGGDDQSLDLRRAIDILRGREMRLRAD